MIRHDILCQIVGTMSDMAVNEGETVVKGQMICQIESMKTMFPQYASESGVVHFVAELGEMIGEGECVAWVESD